MVNRKLTAVGLFVCAIFLPWWVTIPLAIGLILFYQDFFEAILIFFYLDLLFGLGVDGWRGYFVFTIGGLLFIMLVEAGRQFLLVRN